MFNDVTQGRDSLKRIIQTVINLLPESIKNYPPDDQHLLNDFLTVLQHYSEADNQRERLSKRFEDYRKKNYLTDLYFRLPFLWFAHDYFANANLLLNLAEFHGTRFYEYLARSLRRDPEVRGVFQLVRKLTPLSDPLWEQLQVSKAYIKIQLNDEQLQIIKTSYTALQDLGIQGLNTRSLYSFIKRQNTSPSTKSLSKFFTLLDSQWSLWFYPPAFGLKQVYVNFQVIDPPLTKLIDFENNANTTLCNSRVYRIRGSPHHFSGYLEIPNYGLPNLENYLYDCEDRGKLKIHELTEISDIRISTSFTLYQVNKGWIETLPTRIKNSTLPLKSDQSRSFRSEIPFFLSPKFNQKWDFLQSPDPARVIHIFCLYRPQEFYFNTLNFCFPSKQKSGVPIEDLGLIKYFHQKGICNILLFQSNLLYNFSPDFYEIIMPVIPIERLYRLLSWLPYSRILFTDKKIHLWAFLPTNIQKWMKKIFPSWEFRICITYHYFLEPNPLWFNFETLEWRNPQIFE